MNSELFIQFIMENTEQASKLMYNYALFCKKMQDVCNHKISGIPSCVIKKILEELTYLNRVCFQKTGKRFLTETLRYHDMDVASLWTGFLFCCEHLTLNEETKVYELKE